MDLRCRDGGAIEMGATWRQIIFRIKKIAKKNKKPTCRFHQFVEYSNTQARQGKGLV
jgi:hypothetical protein